MTEQQKIFIKPALGADGKPLQVRKHDKPLEFLKEAGEWVVKHTHWLRRLKDGSVVEATPPADITPATAKPVPAAKEMPASSADTSPADADSKTTKATKAAKE